MAKDTIRLICPNLKCRRVLAVPVTARGKTIRCGSCGTSISVPASAQGSPNQGQDAKSGASKG
jgi:hypothetical protein